MWRTEELTLAASFESPGLSLVMNYAAKMCRVSFMREAPAQLRVSVPLSLSLSGVLFAVNLTFDWITVIPIDPD